MQSGFLFFSSGYIGENLLINLILFIFRINTPYGVYGDAGGLC